MPCRNRAPVSGRIVDWETGENIAFASIAEAGTGRGTTTNQDGYFSLKADGRVSVSCIGYEPLSLDMGDGQNGDTAVVIRLRRKEQKLDEVVVSATVPEVEAVVMSKSTVPVALVKAMPSFTGEPDIIKAITFLPGVQGGRDGMSDIFVRGGDRGQNLIMLDGMKIYNSSHMFGIVSLFNTDMVKNVDVYKGIFPARYGGRLASVIDVTSRDGDEGKRGYHISVGMLSSTAFAQGPIVPGKLTFAVAARAGYNDLFNMGARKEFYDVDIKSSETYAGLDRSYVSESFYDINARLRWKMTPTATLASSVIIGSDFERYGEASRIGKSSPLERETGRTAIRNNGVSLTFSKGFDKTFWLTSASFTSYRNTSDSKTESRNPFTMKISSTGFDIKGALREIALKSHTEVTLGPGKLRAGAEISRYIFSPSRSSLWEESDGARKDSASAESGDIRSVESSAYAEGEIDITSDLRLDIGLRTTAYHASAALGESGKTFARIEPRASLRLMFARHISLKTGFSVANQFNHCMLAYIDDIQSETWVAATGSMPPQKARQAAFGLFYANDGQRVNLSAEGFYKWMSDLQHCRSARVFRNGVIESSVGEEILTGGDGRAYGVEVMASKDMPHGVSASLAYTWMRSERKFDGVNGGRWFPHLFERRHSLTATGIWAINDKWKSSASFNFATGNPFTMPSAYVKPDMTTGVGRYIFTDINNRRMPNYHRLDLNIARTHACRGGAEMQWTLNIYNVYAHKNPSYARFSHDDKACITSDYSILPSLSWSIKF
ncbi:MAG: TonB-dependent receptor domain-containing protein [Marinilabiliaceae bacterium]